MNSLIITAWSHVTLIYLTCLILFSFFILAYGTFVSIQDTCMPALRSGFREIAAQTSHLRDATWIIARWMAPLSTSPSENINVRPYLWAKMSFRKWLFPSAALWRRPFAPSDCFVTLMSNLIGSMPPKWLVSHRHTASSSLYTTSIPTADLNICPNLRLTWTKDSSK